MLRGHLALGGEVGAMRQVRGPSTGTLREKGPLTPTLSPLGEGAMGEPSVRYSIDLTVSVGGLRLPQNLGSSTLDLSMAAPGSLMFGPQASSVTVPVSPMMS